MQRAMHESNPQLLKQSQQYAHKLIKIANTLERLLIFLQQEQRSYGSIDKFQY